MDEGAEAQTMGPTLGGAAALVFDVWVTGRLQEGEGPLRREAHASATKAQRSCASNGPFTD